MKVCAVSSCRKDSTRCPGVIFFNIPRDPCAKSEWLEALGIKHREGNQNIKVCDAHFRSKDFCSGRRQLKGHAVPALNLGVSKTVSCIDDEFMHYDSDNDADILEEVKKFSCNDTVMDRKTKGQIEEEKNREEQEPETGRRPSRRAAREAAKKIFNTVRNYGTVPDADDPDVCTTGFTPKFASSPRSAPRQRQKAAASVKIPPPNIDLIMECHEELLSTVQAEALLQAQIQYNMVMKTLRSLRASNVRIICAPADPIPPENSDDGLSSSGENEETHTNNSTSPNTVPLQEVKIENGSVYPMELSTDIPSPAPILS